MVSKVEEALLPVLATGVVDEIAEVITKLLQGIFQRQELIEKVLMLGIHLFSCCFQGYLSFVCFDGLF